MELIEIRQAYRLFTKNDRCVGDVLYRRTEDGEDIVFKPFFYREGDPQIGVFYGSIESEDWKTSRELFGRYLDDPDFRLGYPVINFMMRVEMKLPPWVGELVHALAEFDNDGWMSVKYATAQIGVFSESRFAYEGEITLKATSKFVREKMEEDAARVEFWINELPFSSFLNHMHKLRGDGDGGEDDGGDDFSDGNFGWENV